MVLAYGHRCICIRSEAPLAESIKRLTHRYRRLYEQGVTLERLRQYVVRWCYWLWGGLQGWVSFEGGVEKYLRILSPVIHAAALN